MPDVPADAITAALAAKFGPHKAYNRETKTYEPDGDDAAESCVSTFVDLDGNTGLRILTYGEIAQALADVLAANAAQGAAAERAHLDRRITALENALHAYAPDHDLLNGDGDELIRARNQPEGTPS